MKKALIIGAVGAILGVGGATAAIAGATTDDRPHPTATAAPTISEPDARRIAVDATPGATVTETDLQTLDGRPAWKIHISTSTGRQEVSVDAANGRILKVEHSTGDSPQTSRPTTTTAHRDDRRPTDDGPGHDIGDDHGGR
jgi:hypothetical protein